MLILIFLGFLIFPGNEQDSRDSSVSETKSNWLLVMNPQEASDGVLVSEVVMDRPGFVVLREVINEKPGQIVEVSEHLEAGPYTEIIINLPSDTLTDEIDSSGELPLSNDLVAIVYEDDGDKGFNPSFDKPVYINNQVLARYVETGEITPNAVVIPNTRVEKGMPDSVIVNYTDDGFSPTTVQISKGETVQFINRSSRPMWVASNMHPAHNILPTFDQFGVSGSGESYSYTFDRQGVWEYHDHINASKIGEIIVYN